jgi:hypothetical protein
MNRQITPTSVVNRLYSHGVTSTIKLADTEYLVPHSYYEFDVIDTELLTEYDIIAIRGDGFIGYKCFLGQSRDEAIELAKQSEADFFYHKGNKHSVSFTEGLGDK